MGSLFKTYLARVSWHVFIFGQYIAHPDVSDYLLGNIFGGIGLFCISVCVSVCLSIRNITQKVIKGIVMKFYGGVRGGERHN